MVDLPAPDNPVSQMAQLEWPFKRRRSSFVTGVGCQTIEFMS
ncbi:hypothetical protein URH17368_1136 [Alicyclobacillus hesperidum URH17-3-68]|nr:hypothetical protein URH17368_1136 [Alicyclobacillus hesperidum URH17-3-68]